MNCPTPPSHAAADGGGIGAKLDEHPHPGMSIAAASETYHLFFLVPDRCNAARCENWRNCWATT